MAYMSPISPGVPNEEVGTHRHSPVVAIEVLLRYFILNGKDFNNAKRTSSLKKPKTISLLGLGTPPLFGVLLYIHLRPNIHD
jgi:hypothetical protein